MASIQRTSKFLVCASYNPPPGCRHVYLLCISVILQGRIDESGFLQCSYHGWSFEGDGKCAAIPQAADSGPEAQANRNVRACAVSLPTREFQVRYLCE
jgi:nitrite reductase/ring-hydroxylating ferredoxin subunit